VHALTDESAGAASSAASAIARLPSSSYVMEWSWPLQESSPPKSGSDSSSGGLSFSYFIVVLLMGRVAEKLSNLKASAE
jgi:hypothetical protein